MTIKTLTITILLATSLLLFTACESKDKKENSIIAETHAVSETNISTEINVTVETNTTAETNTSVETNATGEADTPTENNVTAETNTTEELDTHAPVITLNGEATVTVFQDGIYVELGATATDDRDGDVNVTVSGSVDTSTLGKYTLTYSATDKAGNSASIDRVVTVVIPKLTSLTLESDATTLNVGEKATLTVMGTYEDDSSKVLTSSIEWIVTPSSSVQIDDTILTALKDTQVTLQAKVDSTRSEVINLNIYWEVNGHRLPPEPDKALNDSTLLGIDTNDNDVRDDVERWIYQEYKDKHPIHIDVAMQGGRAYKLVLETPEKAKEIRKEVDKAVYCQLYYELDADELNESILIKENVLNEDFRSKVYFNTKERMEAYDLYDTLLSGDSYTLLDPIEEKRACDFNTSKYEE